jgi:FemAB-related protein (PEP-CTERM system-associated)
VRGVIEHPSVKAATVVGNVPVSRLSPPARIEHVAPGDPRWDRYVFDHADGTLFHMDGWRRAVHGTFGHEAIYLLATRGPRTAGALPLFFIKSLLAGRMLVSVPYGVGGGIIADDDQTAWTLFEAATNIARDRRARVIDMRSSRAQVPGLPIEGRYVGFRRELPDRVEDVLPWLPRKARAAARNGRNKFRLEARYGDQHIGAVWRLYARNMRRLASINYPKRFFHELGAAFPETHWTTAVFREGRMVAGVMSFLFRDTVMPYFIGTTNHARRCSAASFAYLTVMERAVAEGHRVFDFGRSRVDNAGSYDFKRFHGFAPTPLEYQSWTPPGADRPDLSPSNPAFSLARRVWPALPLRVTRPAGAWLARHIPG